MRGFIIIEVRLVILKQPFLWRFYSLEANINGGLAAMMPLVFKCLIHYGKPGFFKTKYFLLFTPFIDDGAFNAAKTKVVTVGYILKH